MSSTLLLAILTFLGITLAAGLVAVYVRLLRLRSHYRSVTDAEAEALRLRTEAQGEAEKLRDAVRRRVIAFAPFIEKPANSEGRNVEIPLKEFPRILKAIESPDVRDFVEWLLLTAMRPKGVRAFLWIWFDSKAWTLRVQSEKGGNAREFSIEGTLRAVIERRIGRRRLDCPFIFHDGEGRQLDARRVRQVFYAALEACDLPTGKAGYCLYDTKKTATGLLLDAGLSDAEAMDFSGHRTPSMLHHYRTKTAKRHGASVRKRDEYLAKAFTEKRQGSAERNVVSLTNLVAVQGFEPRTQRI